MAKLPNVYYCKSKPTRRDLLLVVGELQNIIGQLHAVYANDRALDTADRMRVLVDRGLNLTIEARSFDPPIAGGSRNGWNNLDRSER